MFIPLARANADTPQTRTGAAFFPQGKKEVGSVLEDVCAREPF
jgi:hypothetical protein